MWYWSFAVTEEGTPPSLPRLEHTAPHCDCRRPQPGICQALAKYKPPQASLLKSCCLCDCSQLQTAGVNPGLIFLLFGRMKSSPSGHTRRCSHLSALSRGVSQGRARIRDTVRGVCPCRWLGHPQCPPQHSGGLRVTSPCSGVFLNPVRSVTERFQVPSQLPLHLPGRKSAADLGLVKPLICAAARHGWVGLTDTPHCRAPLVTFLPSSLALIE